MSDCGYTPEELAAMNEVDALPGENCVTPWVPDHAARVRRLADRCARGVASLQEGDELVQGLEALLAERDEALKECVFLVEVLTTERKRLVEAERGRDEARRERDEWKMAAGAEAHLANEEHARAEAAEQRLAQTRDALRRIKENAESWHGLGEDGPRRALEVIAKWCDAALSDSADTTETA